MLPGEIVFVILGSTGKQLGEVNGSPEVKVLSGLGIVALFAVLFLMRRIVAKRVRMTE